VDSDAGFLLDRGHRVVRLCAQGISAGNVQRLGKHPEILAWIAKYSQKVMRGIDTLRMSPESLGTLINAWKLVIEGCRLFYCLLLRKWRVLNHLHNWLANTSNLPKIIRHWKTKNKFILLLESTTEEPPYNARSGDQSTSKDPHSFPIFQNRGTRGRLPPLLPHNGATTPHMTSKTCLPVAWIGSFKGISILLGLPIILGPGKRNNYDDYPRVSQISLQAMSYGSPSISV